jgi:DNA repair protein RecN (Recombination protein N)
MLRRLEIENFGLIAGAAVDFSSGATIFTGETGSGKTMLLAALDFALGARGPGDALGRAGARTLVTLRFDPTTELREQLATGGFELDPDEDATIEREAGSGGRSSARLNGRTATAAVVREIGATIAEIVGQHEAQRLLSPAYHEDLLDRFAGPDALAARERLARIIGERDVASRRLERFDTDAREIARALEDARYAIEEIERAAPQLGEDDRAHERQRYLLDARRIDEALATAAARLGSGDGGASDSIGDAVAALSPFATYGERFETLVARANALQADATDLAGDVSAMRDDGEGGPEELERIEERLDELERLKRKYGGTLDAVLECARSARDTLDGYEKGGAGATQLRERIVTLSREAVAVAATLSRLRRDAATRLARNVKDEFADLALASGSIEVALRALDEPGVRGAERAELLFAANVGETPRPLARIASGGERSRVLLAMIAALAAERDATAALIFDEIDAGIGGATGGAVGARIGRLARGGQVVCVTHLAQLAAWAGRHYALRKHEARGRTEITVEELSSDERRIAELARMLSGETHDAALAHARTLLTGVRSGDLMDLENVRAARADRHAGRKRNKIARTD